MSPFIVAELSANHLGSVGRAMTVVDAAARAGASAVKFQTFTPESMVADPAYILPSGPWAGRKLIDLYREAMTPWEWHARLFKFARELDMIPFSTPFDAQAVDFLETLNCPIYKIASFEVTDLPLIHYAAQTGKSLIISTGMATAEEITDAVVTARKAGCKDLTLLKCTSAYPAPASAANLATILDMASYGCRVGLSDHSPGIGVAVAAVAMGATVIEKHLTLSRTDGGPDAKFSMEPDEFSQLVTECNRAYEAIGEAKYGPSEAEQSSVNLRRSLYFAKDLKAGQVVQTADIRTARVALGLPPKDLDIVIGRRVTKDVRAGQPVSLEVIDARKYVSQ